MLEAQAAWRYWLQWGGTIILMYNGERHRISSSFASLGQPCGIPIPRHPAARRKANRVRYLSPD